ncbi:MAG: C2 family cysteine protease, partial [Planctomycetota bacterium]
VSAVARDQFGQNLEIQVAPTWQMTASPAGSNPKLTTNDSSATFSPDVSGKYTLRAFVGPVFTDIPMTVSQTLTELSLIQTDGTIASADAPLGVDKTSATLKIAALDQFGKAMTTLPTISWATALAPANATTAVKISGTIASVTFNRIGNYTVNATVGSISARAFFKVMPTLTSFALSRDGVMIARPSTGTSLAGNQLSLNAVARDQFGQNLETQVIPSWQMTVSPTGSNPKLTTTGSSVLFEPDLSGKYTLRAAAGSVFTELPVTVSQTLSAMSLLKADGTQASVDSPLPVDRTTGSIKLVALDQFGKNMITLPKINWATTLAPQGGTATVKLNASNAEVSFNRVGDYALNATFGSITAAAAFKVTPTLTSFAVSRDGKVISGTTNPTLVSGNSISVSAVARDQFGQNLEIQPEQTWSISSAPSGSQSLFETTNSNTTITFKMTGNHTARVTAGAVSTSVNFSVIPVTTTIELTPANFSLIRSASKQMSARVCDQFGAVLATQPSLKWMATGGTVSSKGLYVAGNQAGSFTVSVSAGTISSTSFVEVTDPVIPSGLVDPDLSSLVNTFYNDQNLDRLEMMQVLRSAGGDGSVNATEFADLQFLVSATSPFGMPSHVRLLASDVVGKNSANQRFQGQSLGDLAAGSSASQLNKLIDKWFLGADEPSISTSGLTYQTAIGNLFNGGPSRADTRQGMLGDCYFIAAVASIADRNPDAVRNMFIDNGDGTYTVRFFSSGTSGFTSDYVTVNRRLPAYSNGQLGYSGFGQSISQTSTTLWIALAEKAYAQWNETGLSGRDGTNRYSAIEGGWMWYVNAQVLGADSTYAYFSSSAKSTLMNAISAQQAVTLGTWPNATTGGLYGSHAYIVTSYNASSDTFSLHNPWGVSHPTPLTWPQLQANCSIFVYTATTANNSVSSSPAADVTIQGLIASVQDPNSEQQLQPSAAPMASLSDDRGSGRLDLGKPATSENTHCRQSKDDHPTIALTGSTDFVRHMTPSPELPAELLDLNFSLFHVWLLEVV